MAGQSGDMFGDLFGGSNPFASGPLSTPPKKKAEKGADGGWKAKIIDGQYYVPLAQVSKLLEDNAVLPAVRRGIDKRVADLAEKQS